MLNWADKLIQEYSYHKKELEHLKTKLDPINPKDNADLKIINSMIDDMSYALEWMRKERRPGNLHGVDKRSIYQRRALLDMDLFPTIELDTKQSSISEEQKQEIINILVELSHRERQCYLMHMAYGMSLTEIAEELNLKKRTVQQYIDRAKDKVKILVS
ncbi:sigma-70 family RNA polymerase sigma factor [Psychrobacillus vulpis]|uniref:Sigma-70 family RNA polymerase sigma factor n=1 Tax=Psychrobacillus vulpis TaxID=2325572 RepID=A0A544TSK8_9BACI|nr:sigma-70 family RNA polymerase sigma factor [Psychrobacillus vulpis]TQR20439.1 sigma-70 family RNA polymerase sigma factor [Psychrobacillus vulpis]